MAESTHKGETKWHKLGRVQVYARRDDQGRPVKADAIDDDQTKIRAIADQLQRSGFGVLRQRNPRAGRVYYRLDALWVGAGDPPENPFGPDGGSGR